MSPRGRFVRRAARGVEFVTASEQRDLEAERERGKRRDVDRTALEDRIGRSPGGRDFIERVRRAERGY